VEELHDCGTAERGHGGARLRRCGGEPFGEWREQDKIRCEWTRGYDCWVVGLVLRPVKTALGGTVAIPTVL
jgi:hypothetical protein